MEKILIVDDEPDILEFLQYNLQKEGYETSIASNGKEALDKAAQFKPQMIILDVMMPEMDGVEACKELRKNPLFKETVILFLTARGEDYSQIAAFDAGADDYITKPIRLRVLISKIKAILRRIRSEEDAVPLEVGDLIIDREKYLVFREGVEIIMPKKEFELLILLASRPNKVFTREEILSTVWGNSVVVGDRTIDVHIRKLREKIGEESIRTIKGVGYKFED
jgi:two-component system alkaline phosphatase synthesis response regulator PhoP